MTCDAGDTLVEGSEKLWLPDSRGVSEEDETCTARLPQSPTSHSPCALGELCTLWQVRWIRVRNLSIYMTICLVYNLIIKAHACFSKISVSKIIWSLVIECYPIEYHSTTLTWRVFAASNCRPSHGHSNRPRCRCDRSLETRRSSRSHRLQRHVHPVPALRLVSSCNRTVKKKKKWAQRLERSVELDTSYAPVTLSVTPERLEQTNTQHNTIFQSLDLKNTFHVQRWIDASMFWWRSDNFLKITWNMSRNVVLVPVKLHWS